MFKKIIIISKNSSTIVKFPIDTITEYLTPVVKENKRLELSGVLSFLEVLENLDSQDYEVKKRLKKGFSIE